MAVLYVASVPWYRSAGEEPGSLLGLPGWVAVALLCYVAAAFANAAAWLLTDVPDVPDVRDAPRRAEEAEARPREEGP